MKPKTNFLTLSSEVGKISQIMPAWVRAVCRSRLDYDEDEILELYRKQSIGMLENSHLRDRFRFIEKHIYVLEIATPEKVRRIITAQERMGAKTTGMFVFCRYQADDKKRACWSCRHVRTVISKLLKEEDYDEEGNKEH